MNNEFLKSLQAFGMEGMGIEETYVDPYAGSECSEELTELDNIDAITTAMESMNDAIIESGLAPQVLALEAAGFSLDTASGFTGELSTEAIGNMVKRGYYEVKIQIKKGLQKLWKLILALVDHVMGSEGRLKSYGKLFKKYNERLRKTHPKDNKDGESREVTVRKWEDEEIPTMVKLIKDFGGPELKQLVSGFKALDIKTGITGIIDGVADIYKKGLGLLKELGIIDATKETAAITKFEALKGVSVDDVEKFEKAVQESLSDDDLKDSLKDLLSELKNVDSDEMKIEDAKTMLLKVGVELEKACDKDLRFKRDLLALKKAWDKKTGEWKLSGDVDSEANRKTAAILRALNKCGSLITGYRMFLSKFYSITTSKMQGVLADMAKVIAKGTNIGA